MIGSIGMIGLLWLPKAGVVAEDDRFFVNCIRNRAISTENL